MSHNDFQASCKNNTSKEGWYTNENTVYIYICVCVCMCVCIFIYIQPISLKWKDILDNTWQCKNIFDLVNQISQTGHSKTAGLVVWVRLIRLEHPNPVGQVDHFLTWIVNVSSDQILSNPSALLTHCQFFLPLGRWGHLIWLCLVIQDVWVGQSGKHCLVRLSVLIAWYSRLLC